VLRRNQLDDGIGDTFVLGPPGTKCAGICVDGETKQILGAAILGVGGELDFMYAKAPYSVIQCAVHISADGLGISAGHPRQLEPFT
jgi:hypothetical protein